MSRRVAVRRVLRPGVAFLPLLLAAAFASTRAANTADVPADLKIAFFGDQGLGTDSVAVLDLVKAEGAQAIVHLGDFDYDDDPAAWEAQVDAVLGSDFPYLGLIGNHDEGRWSGPGGYQDRLEARLRRLGIAWEGDLGVRSTLNYHGVFMVFVAPGIRGSGHDLYLRDRLAADGSIWKIAAWHKVQRLMQVGLKQDETGWGVYEEARKGGAIVATAHEHSYSRTHLLSGMESRTIASTAATLDLAPGQTFAFVSGLGGQSIRPQVRSGSWWASIYTSTQGARSGALFGVFAADGVPNHARFYFKDVQGRIVDRFEVVSRVNGAAAVSTVSAASYRGPVAPESIGATFGVELATGTHSAPSTPLPFTLGGTSVSVRDAEGAERPAPLFFVSPTQVNFQVPAGTAAGTTTVTVKSAAGTAKAGVSGLATVAPGIFTANGDGAGVPAASVLRVRADGSQTSEPVAELDPGGSRYMPRPIDLGPETDQVFLILYATGLRHRPAGSSVSVTLGGTAAEVLFAGAHASLVGVDQVNVRIPRSLAGRGLVDARLTVQERPANVVQIGIR